ncbi:CAP domain-containing protein [Pararhodobacter sp. CCB-MM2]|uniref:CAP domain-containing protein n=1 Tax=Pararhodobacter sp. CCB-MM2 TaxID=1786003 RepID=UPI000830B647|nr:CAP domain-containing protein [Pararhodobacter sp. CCB-MM2]
MLRTALLSLLAPLLLAACVSSGTGGPVAQLGPDGRPVQSVYRISDADIPEIQARMRDALNTVRQQSGLMPVEFQVALTSAAATHARDMSVQARPWHFGSDGSSPIDRVHRVGYTGYFIGEVVSETYETEVETLTAWLSQEDTRAILMDPRAQDLGFAWYQEPNGKLWYVLGLGNSATMPTNAAQTLEQQAPVADTRPNR